MTTEQKVALEEVRSAVAYARNTRLTDSEIIEAMKGIPLLAPATFPDSAPPESNPPAGAALARKDKPSRKKKQ
jgi:hypothetical protein